MYRGARECEDLLFALGMLPRPGAALASNFFFYAPRIGAENIRPTRPASWSARASIIEEIKGAVGAASESSVERYVGQRADMLERCIGIELGDRKLAQLL